MTAQERIEQLTNPGSHQAPDLSVSRFFTDAYDNGLKAALAKHPAETKALETGAVGIAAGLAVGALFSPAVARFASGLFGRSGAQAGVEAGLKNEALLASLRSPLKIEPVQRLEGLRPLGLPGNFDTTLAEKIKPQHYAPVKYSHLPQSRLSDLPDALKSKRP